MKTITHTNDSLNLYYFLERNDGWQSYATDKKTMRTVQRLLELGRIVHSDVSLQIKLQSAPL